MNMTYLNPVYDHSFADPFVLKYCGEYWAYCTGIRSDGRCFGIAHSRDLVHWHELGGALEPLPGNNPEYWAPEVTYANGRFYMYYSTGDEATMQLRVAVASHPAGPFVDSGHRLTSETFAIDGHVFIDDDGAWHLFYATDFLEGAHVGTGTVRDWLRDPFTLAGQPAPVTLPRYDWHVYDPQRAEKGGVRWHTIEGSFVLKHKRRYYQMFSGGNWQNLSYGVSYATAESLSAPGEWRQMADGERVLPVLRTLPGLVIGPGHNSVARGPDNMQLFCIYHRWAADSSARVMAIDRLDWVGARMIVLGPSTMPQPAPNRPAFADFFDRERASGLGAGWECAGGAWAVRDGAAVQQSAAGVAQAIQRAPASHAIVEVSLRALDSGPDGAYGLAVAGQLSVLLAPAHGRLIVRLHRPDQAGEAAHMLPHGFDARAYHLLRLEINAGRVSVSLDGQAVPWSGELAGDAGTVALVTEHAAAAFAGFALTTGWQDLFEADSAPAADLGWQGDDSAGWRVAGQRLQWAGGAAQSQLGKGPLLAAYELVVNARLASAEATGGYGIYPAMRPGQPGPLLTIERGQHGWALVCRDGPAEQLFFLPDFDPASFQQLRFRKQAGQISIQSELTSLGTIPAPGEPASIGLYASQPGVAFDLVRVTAIQEHS